MVHIFLYDNPLNGKMETVGSISEVPKLPIQKKHSGTLVSRILDEREKTGFDPEQEIYISNLR